MYSLEIILFKFIICFNDIFFFILLIWIIEVIGIFLLIKGIFFCGLESGVNFVFFDEIGLLNVSRLVILLYVFLLKDFFLFIIIVFVFVIKYNICGLLFIDSCIIIWLVICLVGIVFIKIVFEVVVFLVGSLNDNIYGLLKLLLLWIVVLVIGLLKEFDWNFIVILVFFLGVLGICFEVLLIIFLFVYVYKNINRMNSIFI